MVKPEYRNGGDGFCLWAEENVRIPVYPPDRVTPVWISLGKLPDTINPETGRSYKQMWEEQKTVCREALRMENGRFVHRLIVLCWMRGEGKSFLICLIQLWKFFCWPRQQIVCGANSKEQTKFVHYDIMRDLILHSPKLLAPLGKKNIKEKEIVFKDKAGNSQSVIRCISSFSGIVSNITGYTFSEIFDMKNPKFFTQLDGSIRNIPNAIGGIDSTVSAKDHILYRLYTAFKKGEDPTLYFSYRCSREGHHGDYWNPMMTTKQLASYKTKFLQADFERYFLNLWSAGSARVFTPEMIEATNYLGVDRAINSHPLMIELLKQKNKYLDTIEKTVDKLGIETNASIEEIYNRLWPVEDVLKLKVNGLQSMVDLNALARLSDIFDTEWAITAGMDRADPMKTRTNARTIIAAVAKGLIGSRSRPVIPKKDEALPYLYILIHLANVASDSLEDIKSELEGIHSICEIDSFGSERWGAWDLEQWCIDRNIKIELWSPTFNVQRAMFTELYLAYNSGRFKAPPLAIYSENKDLLQGKDLLQEEAAVFDYDPDAKWYGSPEKMRKGGVQDDTIYAVGACIYVARDLSYLSFRQRKGAINFGVMIPPAVAPMGSY